MDYHVEDKESGNIEAVQAYGFVERVVKCEAKKGERCMGIILALVESFYDILDINYIFGIIYYGQGSCA